MSNSTLETKAAVIPVKTGIDQENRKKVAHQLSAVLASTYQLYLKTQGFHWNVAGPLFYSLHEITEEQYTDMAEAIDELAERIRALGFPAPASFEQFRQLASIDGEQGVPTAAEMIEQLIQDNETCVKQMREVAEYAEKIGDLPTHDMLIERMTQHEKNNWMLRALLA